MLKTDVRIAGVRLKALIALIAVLITRRKTFIAKVTVVIRVAMLKRQRKCK